MSLMSWGRGCCTKPTPSEYYGGYNLASVKLGREGRWGDISGNGQRMPCIMCAAAEGWAGAAWGHTDREDS